MICICELLENESMTLMRDFGGPYDGEFTPWLVGPGVPLHRDLVRHDSRCPMFEREAVVRYLKRIGRLHDATRITEYSDPLADAYRRVASKIEAGRHHATLQEAQGPDSAPE